METRLREVFSCNDITIEATVKNDFGFTISGVRIPSFLYGTAWKGDDTERCVESALAAGFRGIDTANQRKHYFEAGVGTAIKKCISRGQLTRKDLFLQTKFTSIEGQDKDLPYDADASYDAQVKQSFASSLEHLHTDYLDSYVLHGPTSARGLGAADWEIWHAMENLQQQGLVKLLGVSNVDLEQLRAICERSKVRPTFVQNRCYARRGWDSEIRAYCRENQLVYQGFSLLTANQEIFRNPLFIELVKEKGCSPAQAIFRFALSVGLLPLTGTTNPEHMSEDLESVKFVLSPEEVRVIEGLSI